MKEIGTKTRDMVKVFPFSKMVPFTLVLSKKITLRDRASSNGPQATSTKAVGESPKWMVKESLSTPAVGPTQGPSKEITSWLTNASLTLLMKKRDRKRTLRFLKSKSWLIKKRSYMRRGYDYTRYLIQNSGFKQ